MNEATSWKNVRYQGDAPPWRTEFVEGKGFCAFATRNFSQGDVICIETPTVWVHGHHPFSPSQLLEIESNLGKLSKEDHDSFFNMANVFEDDPSISKPAGVFMTNSFDMTDSPEGESCAMYCAIARLNHSCQPNTQQTHYPDTSEEYLIASRDIDIGEELNDCYIDLRANTTERQSLLQSDYRFLCDCGSCGSDPRFPLTPKEREEMDTDRTLSFSLEEQAIQAAEVGDLFLSLSLSEELVSLLNKPLNLNRWSARYLSGAYLSLSMIHTALADENEDEDEEGEEGENAEEEEEVNDDEDEGESEKQPQLGNIFSDKKSKYSFTSNIPLSNSKKQKKCEPLNTCTSLPPPSSRSSFPLKNKNQLASIHTSKDSSKILKQQQQQQKKREEEMRKEKERKMREEAQFHHSSLSIKALRSSFHWARLLQGVNSPEALKIQSQLREKESSSVL